MTTVGELRDASCMSAATLGACKAFSPAAQQLNFTELSNLDCLINVVFDGKVFNVTVTSL
jgi:hypothetical protein